MSRTIPNNPANALTPSYSTVSSPAGFQSGDLVYYKGSSFGTIPDNVATSGSFPISATVRAAQYPNNQTVRNLVLASHAAGNAGRQELAAKLSNGNIVVVYSLTITTSGVQFRVVDQDFVQVVAETAVSGSSIEGSVGVCALVGGGFVVSFTSNGDNKVYYRVYSNTGVVVSSLTQFSASDGLTHAIKPLPNGGFVIATNSTNGTGALQCRTFDSIGVGVSSLVNFGTLPLSSNTGLFIGVYSDNSFTVCSSISSGYINAYSFNTSGAFTNALTIATDWSNSGQYSFTSLDNDTSVLVYTESATGNFFAYGRLFFPSTNTTSAIGNINSSPQTSDMDVQGISGGKFVAISGFNNSIGGRRIEIRNNNGTVVSGSSQSLFMFPGNTSNQNKNKVTIIEGTTNIIFVGAFTNGPQPSVGLPALQILKASPYTLRSFTSPTVQVGSATAALSGYARSGSTPNSAALFAATTQTLSVVVPASSGTIFQLTPYSPTGEQVQSLYMATMLNSQFVTVYLTNSGAVKFSVFNFDGSVVQTQTVVASGAGDRVFATCLTNGKLVITYSINSTRVDYAIYSTGYSLLVSGNTSEFVTMQGTSTINQGFGTAALDSSNFVIGYCSNGGYASAIVFNDVGGYITAVGDGSYVTASSIKVAGNANGNFTVTWFANSYGATYTGLFFKNSTSYYYYTQFGNISGGTNVASNYAVITPSGTGATFVTNTGGAVYLSRYPTNQSSTQTYVNVGGDANNVNLAMCISSTGNILVFRCDNGATNVTQYSSAFNPNPFSGSQQSSFQANSITLSDFNTGKSYPAITCLYGDTYAFAYRTSAGLFKVGLLCTQAQTFTSNITAGVTACLNVFQPAPSNGYYLAGVSASECPAGGTGVLQVNGVASLSSQYPAGTASQAFDFTSPALDAGVRGTIAGRNVIISGAK